MAIIDPPVADGCTSDRIEVYARALNDCGDVTGIINDFDEPTCTDRPFAWCFCENAYQLTPRVTRNLAVLAGQDEMGSGLTINNAGVIGGFSEATFLQPFPNGHPWVWELLGYDPVNDELEAGSSYSIDDDEIGVINSINDSENALAVGWVRRLDESSVERQLPYKFTMDVSSAVELVSFADSDDEGSANAVVTPLTSEDVRFVGGSIGAPSNPCDDTNDAVKWTGSSATPGQLDEGSAWNSVALAANPQGQSGGFRRTGTSSSPPCDKVAVFWDEDDEPTVVGTISPLSSDDATEGLGLSPADTGGGGVVLVGANRTDIAAVLWWRDPSTLDFVSILASELTIFLGATPIDEIETFEKVLEFVDINALGWILGNAGFDSPDPETLVPPILPVVLIPDPCPADFNLDEEIDGADQAILLGNWGACSGSGYCEGDLNFDGTVGGADLAILLGAWGTCVLDEVCDLTPCASQMESSVATGTNPLVLTAVQVLGFSSLEAFGSWLVNASDTKAYAAGESLLAIIEEIGGNQ